MCKRHQKGRTDGRVEIDIKLARVYRCKFVRKKAFTNPPLSLPSAQALPTYSILCYLQLWLYEVQQMLGGQVQR